MASKIPSAMAGQRTVLSCSREGSCYALDFDQAIALATASP